MQRLKPTSANPEIRSDGQLLADFRGGSDTAFLAIYRRHQGTVFRFALYMSGFRESAEEITQDVFLALLANPGGYQPERGTLEGYLLGVARNLVRRNRTQVGATTASVREDSAVHEPDQAELLAVREAVLALPSAFREVVVLCEIEGFSYEEAARALGCALGTVRSRLHRARGMLLARLQAKRETCPA